MPLSESIRTILSDWLTGAATVVVSGFMPGWFGGSKKNEGGSVAFTGKIIQYNKGKTDRKRDGC